MQKWEVEATSTFVEWFHELTDEQAEAVAMVVDRLEAVGPQLGRPTADHVKGSKHQNMKELRTKSGHEHFRVLFAFDPRRTGLLLVGGSKTGKWNDWYPPAIAKADRLYDDHLAELATEQ